MGTNQKGTGVELMEKAIKLTTDLEVQVIDFNVGDSYNMLSESVGGYVECVSLTPTIDMWINEEGKLLGLEPNIIATELLWETSRVMNDIIVGNVVFASNDEEGETTGLSNDDIRYLNGFLKYF